MDLEGGDQSARREAARLYPSSLDSEDRCGADAGQHGELLPAQTGLSAGALKHPRVTPHWLPMNRHTTFIVAPRGAFVTGGARFDQEFV